MKTTTVKKTLKRSKLKIARKKKELSQEDVAEIVGISRSFYNQIENGERNPSFEITVRISNVLDLDVREWR